ncbi:MAG: hypothetical protein E7598_06180 [Ruminococcaceae bacterium]|nr:hypothetical protein [Oscillospiraceae bacterium]
MDEGKEIQKRKPTRLKDFDYNMAGAYFITICTRNRRNILSTIVGEGSPLPQLSHCGKIADKWVQRIAAKYAEISVDNYVIMPNHIHLLLLLTVDDGRGDPSPTIVAAIGWLKYQITKEINETCNMDDKRIFQRSFHDHVVRNRQDYQEIVKYICENPARWYFDKLYLED